MASQYVIDLGYNDDLTTVIKKVNHNFKAVMGQQTKQAQIDSEEAAEVVAEIVGDAVADLVAAIGHEADLRIAGDNDLDNAIDGVSDNLGLLEQKVANLLKWTHVKTEDTRGTTVFTPSIIDLTGVSELCVLSSSATGNGVAIVPIAALEDSGWSSFITSTNKIFKARTEASPANVSFDSGCVWNVYAR